MFFPLIIPPESGWDIQRVCGTDEDIRGHQAGQEGPFQELPTGGIRRWDCYPASPRNGFLPPRLTLLDSDFLLQQKQQKENVHAADTSTPTVQLCLRLRRSPHGAVIGGRERTELPETETESLP